MSKYIGPKCRLCRREGMKLFLKGERCNTAKCAIVKRNYPPGAQGQKGAGARLTDYGRQLREKQKARRVYNLQEKQFRNYFEKAVAKKGETGEIFYELLERRFDNVIYKLGWAMSIAKARQLIGHGHFLINGKKVNIPSYQLKVNDEITIKEKSLKGKVFADLKERVKNIQVPEWLFMDANDLTGKMVDNPQIKGASLPYDMTLIIEYYSR